MEEVRYLGGAKIGSNYCYWPKASLEVTPEKIKLNVLLIGKYEFSSQEVISIEKYVLVPFFGWGVKINHNVKYYPKKIIVWTFGDPQKLIDRINEVGFVPSARKELS